MFFTPFRRVQSGQNFPRVFQLIAPETGSII
ncbi:hypothetical protein T03_11770 [Trichinella britovi]|uniref:Uncharacterized protein n=1 Tax=Trichinella britovi TaxID=45882 RepID=A0A0V1AGY3_TRIBR|nr:hypothetical protein T03_11770 [Trichinella britovi]